MPARLREPTQAAIFSRPQTCVKPLVQPLSALQLALLFLVLGALLTVMPKAHAAPMELDTTATVAGSRATANLQLIVLEAPGCIYCNLFRRHVVPAYNTSPKSRDVPLKFIDLNDKAYDELGLDSPVDMVPTAVLLQNNREVGRIPGYMGPENFFHAINHLMARVH